MAAAQLYGQLQPTQMMQEPYQYQYGLKPTSMMGIDEALKDEKKPSLEDASTKAGYASGLKTAGQTMSAGGSLGQLFSGTGASILAASALSEGGLTAAAGATGGGALAAGLALSLYEQNQQAEAAHERAVAEEAANRKNAVQNAINAQISAARLLSV